MRILGLGAFQRELDSIIEGFPDNNETMIAKRHCRISKRDGHEIFISLSGIGTTAAASTTRGVTIIGTKRYSKDFN